MNKETKDGRFAAQNLKIKCTVVVCCLPITDKILHWMENKCNMDCTFGFGYLGMKCLPNGGVDVKLWAGQAYTEKASPL
jgi:hypothetical protein